MMGRSGCAALVAALGFSLPAQATELRSQAQSQTQVFTTVENYLEPFRQLSEQEQIAECEALEGKLHGDLCVKWKGPAFQVDPHRVSGLVEVESAYSCPHGCSLWELCATGEYKDVCVEAFEVNIT